MSKISISVIVLILVLCGSFTYGAEKPELDTKTTLSVINTVMEFYYARHHGDADKIESMFTELNDYWRTRLSSHSVLFKSKKMEFSEISVTSEDPLTVAVVIKFSYGLESPHGKC